MSQQEIEMILMRQLASYLAVPVLLVDIEGTLIFYNEPAELILGRRFQEAGVLSVQEIPRILAPMNEQGILLPLEALPLSIALTERRPAAGTFYIQGLDNVRRLIDVTAFPLIGQAGRLIGAVSLIWVPSEGETCE